MLILYVIFGAFFLGGGLVFTANLLSGKTRRYY